MDDSQLAEGRQGNETWQEMLQRQRQQQEPLDSNLRERLRSLPQEQEQDKGGSLFGPHEQNSQVAEVSNAAWLEQLREANQRGGHDQNELER